jgi:hypothetical protein
MEAMDTNPDDMRASDAPRPPINVRAEDYGELQRLVDSLYTNRTMATRLDLVVLAESNDLCDDLLEIVGLLPPGTYLRARMCDQLNSSLTAHGWGQTYGTVS